MIRRIAVSNMAVVGLVMSMTLSATLSQERPQQGRKEIVLIAGPPSHG